MRHLKYTPILQLAHENHTDYCNLEVDQPCADFRYQNLSPANVLTVKVTPGLIRWNLVKTAMKRTGFSTNRRRQFSRTSKRHTKNATRP